MLSLAIAPVATFALLGPSSPGTPFHPMTLQPSAVVIPLTPHPLDVDADGDLDLVVANGFLQIQPPALAILENDGRGNFKPRPPHLLSPVTSFTIPRGSLLVDTAGDGAPDAFVIFSEGQVALFPNDPVHGFQPALLGGPLVGTGGGLSSLTPTALAKGDLDGDGREEVVVAMTQINLFGPPLGLGICVVHFDPSGAVSQTVSTSIGAAEIAALELVEITGDSHLDLVCLDTRGDLLIARGQGTGRFQNPMRFPLGQPNSLPDHLALGDLDGDGDLDAVVGHANATALEIFEQVAQTTFQPRMFPLGVPNGGVRHLSLADMDGDGSLDLVTVTVDAALSVSTANVHLGDGLGSFSAAGSQSAGFGTLSAQPTLRLGVLADFDGNATPDLLLSQARNHPQTAGTLGLLASQYQRPYEVRHESVGTPGTHGELGLDGVGPAVRGNLHFALQVSNGPPFAPFLILSSPWTQEAIVEPPLRMLVVPVAFEPGILDAQGTHRFAVPIPPDPVLHGEWGYSQVWVADSGAANTLGIAASRRLAVKVGTRY